MLLHKKYVRVTLKDLTPNKYVSWSQEQLDMKQGVIENYNPRIKPITISSDYKVCDGSHRYVILLDHFGGDHMIIVKKQRYTKGVYTFLGVIAGLILLPMYPIYLLIKKIQEKLHK